MEGKLKTVANPLSPTRMELILSEINVKCQEDKQTREEVDLELHDDDVSIHFYGVTCDCSKQSTCTKLSCLCKKSGLQCNSLCHNGESSKSCKNV